MKPSSSMWTAAFWKGAGERALRSFVQGGVAGLGLSISAQEVGDATLTTLPWLAGLSGAVIMGILSLATSIVSDTNFIAGVDPEMSRPVLVADPAPAAPGLAKPKATKAAPPPVQSESTQG